jgi:hypothetical protein
MVFCTVSSSVVDRQHAATPVRVDVFPGNDDADGTDTCQSGSAAMKQFAHFAAQDRYQPLPSTVSANGRQPELIQPHRFGIFYATRRGG